MSEVVEMKNKSSHTKVHDKVPNQRAKIFQKGKGGLWILTRANRLTGFQRFVYHHLTCACPRLRRTFTPASVNSFSVIQYAVKMLEYPEVGGVSERHRPLTLRLRRTHRLFDRPSILVKSSSEVTRRG